MNKIRIRTVDSFQHKIADWLRVCFGETVAADKRERNFRFLEEAVELVQSLDMTRAQAMRVLEYVYDRPPGEPFQEVGGVEVTLAALCEANGISKDDAADVELDRISNIDVINRIREKQEGKPK